ncbi:MAG: Nif11-like leader peptide family natural product precursor [Gemmataceae bacterium]
MCTQAVHDFMQQARSDQALQGKLRAITTSVREERMAAMVKVGAEAGFDFTSHELSEELKRKLAAGEPRSARSMVAWS